MPELRRLVRERALYAGAGLGMWIESVIHTRFSSTFYPRLVPFLASGEQRCADLPPSCLNEGAGPLEWTRRRFPSRASSFLRRLRSWPAEQSASLRRGYTSAVPVISGAPPFHSDKDREDRLKMGRTGSRHASNPVL